MLAVAVLGVVAVGVFRSTLDVRLERLQVSPSLRQALQPEIRKLADAQVPPQADSAARPALRQALNDSFVDSFRAVSWIAVATALLSSLCAWVTIDRESGQRRA
jgi:hypothetical protein